MAIKDILNKTTHRPWAIPKEPWQYYQEWNKALFLHWEIPLETIQKCIPKKLTIDSINGKHYISLVAFTMQNVRPTYLPSIRAISDFYEVNLRTYIEHNGKKGVYFLSINVSKYLSALIAKKLSGLPYEKSNINRTETRYSLNNKQKSFHFDSEYNVKEPILNKTELDKWLTERYCLYFEDKAKLYRYDIHHKEWEINTLDLNKLFLQYNIDGINLSNKRPDLLHYSNGVQVLSWNKQVL